MGVYFHEAHLLPHIPHSFIFKSFLHYFYNKPLARFSAFQWQCLLSEDGTVKFIIKKPIIEYVLFFKRRFNRQSKIRILLYFYVISQNVGWSIGNLLVLCELSNSACPHRCEFKAYQVASTGISCQHSASSLSCESNLKFQCFLLNFSAFFCLLNFSVLWWIELLHTEGNILFMKSCACCSAGMQNECS